MKRLALLALGLFLPLALAAQFVRVEGRNFVQPDGSVLQMKGTNLGNWLVPEGYMWQLNRGGPESPREIEALVELLLGPDRAAAFWKTYRDRYVMRDDIALLARTGVNTLRVPLHYKFFLTPDGEGFPLLDRVVAWCRAEGLLVILDLHCAPGGQTGTNIDDSLGYPWLFESESAQEQLLTVWRNLARHYRDEPAILGYDVMNEPLPAFAGWEKLQPRLEPLLRRALAAIREIDPHHIVMFTGAHWSTDFSLLGAPPQPNVAYTFHKYWMPPEESEIRAYLDFRAKHNVPIWVGETGENTDEWVGAFRRLLDAHEIGWTFWPYKKMGSRASFAHITPPVHWEKIQAFARLRHGTDAKTVQENLKLRPSAEEIEAAFADLLRKIEIGNCELNRGYIEALGLRVPEVR